MRMTRFVVQSRELDRDKTVLAVVDMGISVRRDCGELTLTRPAAKDIARLVSAGFDVTKVTSESIVRVDG